MICRQAWSKSVRVSFLTLHSSNSDNLRYAEYIFVKHFSWGRILIACVSASEDPVAELVSERPDLQNLVEACVPSLANRTLLILSVQQLYNLAKQHKPRLIIIILPENAAGLYTAAKHFGDVAHGSITQCVVSSGSHTCLDSLTIISVAMEPSRERQSIYQQSASKVWAGLQCLVGVLKSPAIPRINMKCGGVNFVPNNDMINFLRNDACPTLILGGT